MGGVVAGTFSGFRPPYHRHSRRCVSRRRVSQTANPTTAAAASTNETMIQPDDNCRSAKRGGVIVHGAYSGRSRSEWNIPKARLFRLDHDPASRCRRLHRAIIAPALEAGAFASFSMSACHHGDEPCYHSKDAGKPSDPHQLHLGRVSAFFVGFAYCRE